ncbi:hypothetical protein D3C73_1125690 [compost metagenome]
MPDQLFAKVAFQVAGIGDDKIPPQKGADKYRSGNQGHPQYLKHHLPDRKSAYLHQIDCAAQYFGEERLNKGSGEHKGKSNHITGLAGPEKTEQNRRFQ